MSTGGNWSTRSTIFRFLALGNYIADNQAIDNDFLKYMQQYIHSLINIIHLPSDSKEAKDNAFKLVNEGYEKYVDHVQGRLGIKKPKSLTQKENKKVTEKSKEEVQQQNIKAVKNITTNKDGSIKGFKNIKDLVKSVHSIMEKK